jgi:hypothetical protein
LVMKWVLRWLARVYTTTTTSVVEMFKHGGKNGTQQQHFFFPSFWLGEFLTRGKVPWTTLNPRMRRLDPPENLQCGAFFFFFFWICFVLFCVVFPSCRTCQLLLLQMTLAWAKTLDRPNGVLLRWPLAPHLLTARVPNM